MTKIGSGDGGRKGKRNLQFSSLQAPIGMFWQLAIVTTIAVLLALIMVQTGSNLKQRGIASGFDYLHRPTGFEISEGVLSYSSRDTYARALAVGLMNTLRVSVLGIVIATVLGALIGTARISSIWIVSAIARIYIEVFRNTPLLLQLLFWYSLSQALPDPHRALNPVPGVYLCVRGLFLPKPVWNAGSFWIGCLVLLLMLFIAIKLRHEGNSRGLSLTLIFAGIFLGLWFVRAAATQLPLITLERPVLKGFNFYGGISVSPEFAALLTGLSIFTAAYIAEIVRGGILAIDPRQKEAAAALGLSGFNILRLVILPQALRPIIPPLTSQFLNLTKNSSLAVAIGYPELIAVSNTTLNQTGQAVEAIAVVMAVYLTISLAISFVTNFYNERLLRRGVLQQS